MRILVIAFIIGVAAVMSWLIFQPECRGGQVFTNEQHCVSTAGYDRRFCEQAFSRRKDAVYQAGNVFATQSDCQMRHPVCIEYPATHGWTPKPSGYCVVRAGDGALAGMTPVYGPRK